MRKVPFLLAVGAVVTLSAIAHAQTPAGIVSHIKVLSDKVEDVSSMEAWKKSFIKDDMTGEQKALAIWKSIVKFRHVDSPAKEYLQSDACVHDPVKIFNVYGYALCCCASCCDEALSRYVGFEARGWTMPGHSISEVKYDGAWHHFDTERIYYFRKPDGTLASVAEIAAAVAEWGKENPDAVKDDAGLKKFMANDGWKKGPALLAGSEFFSKGGWDPTGGHGWNTVMSLFAKKIDPFEYGYSEGYQVNIQLRPGERLTRNWSHKGLHLNMGEGGAPSCMSTRTEMKYQAKLGDIAPGRVGNGTLEYSVPLGDAALKQSALVYQNLSPAPGGGLLSINADAPGLLVIRMPSSYVYLSGEAALKSVLGPGGSIVVSLSDNNGLDWKEVKRVTDPGDLKIDLKPLVFRRYDYRLKFVLTGKGTGLAALKISHDVQHSQAPLPALAAGKNTITFSSGPPEGTVTIEGSTNPASKGKQLMMADFHPDLQGVDDGFRLTAGKGDATFKVSAPGDITRIRFGAYYRARDARDGFDLQVSFDGGQNFKNVGRLAGPFRGNCTYVTVGDVPAGTKEALVRYSGKQSNTACVFDFRIDADYKEPAGGFRPIKITYVWDEAGVEKRDERVAKSPGETYTITCAGTPVMKSIALELVP